MLRTIKATLLTAGLLAAVSTTVAAQDQEAGDINVNLPPRKVEVREDPIPSRSSVGEPGPLRVYGGVSVALGGSRNYDFDSEFAETLEELLNRNSDLDATLGFQGGADYVVMDYFSIGGEMRFLWTKVDGVADRDFLWDLVVKPRGRYAFKKIPLEVYGALPLGLTVAGISGEPEGKAGFNIGLVGGANWFFTKKMGINAEVGWLFHRYGVDLQRGSYDITMNQFLLLCPNFIYAF
jgi:hypothetical protein